MGKHRYSVGSELQQLLACEDDVLVVTSQQEFERTLATCLLQKKNPPKHLLAVVAELIAVRVPLLALALLAQQDEVRNNNDFALTFWRGVASMAAGDLLTAKASFNRAHNLCADEIAVHNNLALILHTEGNHSAARHWLRAGLQLERNAVQLWVTAQQLCPVQELLNLAEELSAWRGGSLYAQLTDDVNKALALYRRIFASGERGGEFLIEFSGALGHQDCHAELATLAWQLLGQDTLPWQVYEHFAQGFMQLGNAQQARRCTVLANNARTHSTA